MAKTYAFKEAKELIKEFKELLNNLNSSNRYVNKYENEIKNEINLKINSNYFSKILSQDLKELVPTDKNNEEIYGILKAAYCYFKSNEISHYCTNLYDDNNDIITSHIKSLSKGKNALKWFFSNKGNKIEAENSFKELKEELNSSFYKNATNSLEELKSLRDTVTDLIYTDALNNEDKYKNIIFKIDSSILEKGPKVYEIETLFNEYIRIIESFIKIENNFNNYKPDIKNAIDKLIAIELLNILKGIPVEELNREKNGIRVKTLMDYGFLNMADIYTSSVNQLSSIQGISYEAARNIKLIADTFAKEAYKTTKIKINSDDRNTVSSKLVLLLYKYKIRKQIINEKNNLLDLYKQEIDEKLDVLNEIKNGVKYYFSENNQKKNYIETYKWLKNVILGDLFGNKSQNILKDYNSIKEPGILEAWTDFTVDSIGYFNIIEEICPGVLGNDDTYYGLPEKLAREIQEECFFPDGLLCTLR